MMLNRRTHLACAALLPLCGCYAYLAPSSERAPLVGRAVQATLTDSGAVVLASRIGPSVEQLRGQVVSQSNGTIGLAIEETVQRDGTGTSWRREVVDVPRPLIHDLGVRQFSPTRTALFTAVAATIFVAVERGFLKGGGANAPGTSQTGTPGGK